MMLDTDPWRRCPACAAQNMTLELPRNDTSPVLSCDMCFRRWTVDVTGWLHLVVAEPMEDALDSSWALG